MRLTPESEIEIKIATGSAFGVGKIKAVFSVYELPDGGLEFISPEGKTLKVEIDDDGRDVGI